MKVAMAQVVRRLLHSYEAATPGESLLLLLVPLVILLLTLRLLLAASSTTRARRESNDRHRLPMMRELPSPPNKLPIIGHMHLMGALPHVSLRDLAAKHGPDLMLLRLGAVPTVVASSPRAAEAVLRTHDHVFASRPRSMVADIIVYGASDSCYAPYGEHFRKVRKLVTVHLLNAKKVQSHRPAREEEVRLVMGKLGRAAAAHATVDMSELLHSFANDIICRAVSGKFFREEGRNNLFRELIDTNASLLGGFNLEDYFPSLARLELLRKVVCAKARRVSRRWDQLLDKLIDDHASRTVRREQDDAEQEDSDFIDVLLSLQDEYGLARDHMKAILIDMFEGTGTPYLVLEFAMAELMRKPRLMGKLQDEVRRSVPKGQEMVTEDDLAGNGMAYLKAVIKETLRLHPPAPLFIPHLSRHDCDIDGYTIPAGTRVIVNGWALGRHSSYWDMANEFLPERFIHGDGATIDFRGKDFHFLPFGSGRRMCPGIHSAAATIEIMLANLMHRFDWKLPPGLEKEEDIDMTEVFGLTVHRKDKLLLVPKLA